jgi:hypothetical protein
VVVRLDDEAHTSPVRLGDYRQAAHHIDQGRYIQEQAGVRPINLQRSLRGGQCRLTPMRTYASAMQSSVAVLKALVYLNAALDPPCSCI